MKPRMVAVTGAGGFIGREVCAVALARGDWVRGITRSEDRLLPEGVERHVVPEFTQRETLVRALDGADTVVHLAARVHVMRERSADPDAAFRQVNLDGTLAVATAAQAAGVRRLVFTSSIKVNGEATPRGQPFREGDPPNPVDAYGRSKLAAEQALAEVGRAGLDVAVVRPPLVYGPGVSGNLERLMRLIQWGVPLPFGGIENRRSLVGVRNLAGLLLLVATHPKARGETFVAADGDDLSTPAMIRLLAEGLRCRTRLVRVPGPLFLLLRQLPGMRGIVRRLTDSLQVDAGKARRLLGWVPEVPASDGLIATARALRGAA